LSGLIAMSQTDAFSLSDDAAAVLPATLYAEVLAESQAVLRGRLAFADLCDLIARRSTERLPVRGAALLALNPTGDQLIPRAAAGDLAMLMHVPAPTLAPDGPPVAAPTEPALTLADSGLREAVTGERAVWVGDGGRGGASMPTAVSRATITPADRARFGGVLRDDRGLLALPLRCHDHVGGLLVVTPDSAAPGVGAAGVFEPTRAMADLAAVTLSNARLCEAIQASERRYDMVAEHSSDMISIHDPQGRCVYVSPASRGFLHADPEQVVGRSAYDFIHAEDMAMVRAVHERVLNGAQPDHVSFRMCPVDGAEPRWVETSLRLVADPATRDVRRLVCITRDVSEQVRAREQLRRGREELENIVNDQVEMIVRTDAGGIIRFCNTAFAALIGRTPEALVGWDIYQFVPDDQRAMVRERFTAATPARPVWRHEGSMTHADGRRVWLRWTNRALFDDQGRLIGKQGVGIDITERREAEEALKAGEQRQRAIAERLNMLLHELDHRVKNNLAELHSLVTLYRDSKGDVGAFADAIAGKLHAMSTVHELIASGGWRPLELHDVVEALRGHFGGFCDAINLTVTGPSVVIPPRQASALAMILHELLANSQKHGALCEPGGSVTLRWGEAGAVPNEAGAAETARPAHAALGRRLELTWQERGGPTDRPRQQGQGLELIRGLVEFDLAGEARFDMTPGCFSAALCCMLGDVESSA